MFCIYTAMYTSEMLLDLQFWLCHGLTLDFTLPVYHSHIVSSTFRLSYIYQLIYFWLYNILLYLSRAMWLQASARFLASLAPRARRRRVMWPCPECTGWPGIVAGPRERSPAHDAGSGRMPERARYARAWATHAPRRSEHWSELN